MLGRCMRLLFPEGQMCKSECSFEIVVNEEQGPCVESASIHFG